MQTHICEICGKAFEGNAVRRFCGRSCYGKARSAGLVKSAPFRHGNNGSPKHTKTPVDVPAKAGASDNRKHKRLVDERRCRMCEYEFHSDNLGYHCGYLHKTGTTRTAQHPEGLTSDCREFMPKQRKHKYQAPKT